MPAEQNPDVQFSKTTEPHEHAAGSESLLHCRAFQNGRTIANAGALEAMYGILHRENNTEVAAGHPDLVAAVCSAMRRIAVNDDICTEFADLGGLNATMQVLPPSSLNRLNGS